ncbi:trans-Golgi network integral membrane protein 2-like isoform X1 [Varroa jacobsoni]|uniref:Uncharacterized protein n=1 Tax=Varroa destructor TaxID=109461 RepID=A0A7M7J542_VARDE|nr:trans-Golgi network integral membrane protein 2-like isoform X2 [Varroa destructor]XP_022710046.1 trans-Golgi network integral membrane protein 2-like isoform X1 [Varroa jacobsoni]XP_022710048.1 trans-Golgi network integral membrane protein 2-like isoform X1 [Varroa jacobsoni]XP_022710049.1 trans-Golgi network integral membrane protein 2-like isoform X1 [Varroa jacobsoni]XP_022710050.1 trans-Golgi network integral membrane protein 2-like isoform X1 [Varroa jacobsoni]XP_022710051.1 trans-Gol
MVKSPTSEMLITATLVALVAVAGLSLSTNQDPSSSSTLLPVVARSVHVSIQSKVSTTTKAGLLASNGPGRVVIGADPASTGEHAAQGTPGGAAMRNQFSKGTKQLSSADIQGPFDSITQKLQPSSQKEPQTVSSNKNINKDIPVRTELNMGEDNGNAERHVALGLTVDTSERTYKEELIPMGLAPSIYEEDSHMFILFTVGMLLCTAGYVAVHNKRKILALIIEGRSRHNETRRCVGGINYKRVNTCDTGGYGEAVSMA